MGTPADLAVNTFQVFTDTEDKPVGIGQSLAAGIKTITELVKRCLEDVWLAGSFLEVVTKKKLQGNFPGFSSETHIFT